MMFAAVQTAVYIYQLQQNENEEMEEESLSDDDAKIFEEMEQGEGRGGSTPGRQNCQRDFEAAHQQLLNDYFSGTPAYKEYQFERRFGMPRTIFNRIYDELKEIEECTAHTIECIKIDSFKTRKVHAANQHPVDCCFFSACNLLAVEL